VYTLCSETDYVIFFLGVQ